MKRSKLSIGLQRDGKVAKDVRKITRANAAEVLRGLSKVQKNIVRAVFIEHKGIKAISKTAVIGLCRIGIIRKDLDLLSGKQIYVLERGGKFICDEMKRDGRPSKPKPTRVVVKIEKHVFKKEIIAGVVQANCGTCKKPYDHAVHVRDGLFLCVGFGDGQPCALCLNEVSTKGGLCQDCKAKAEAWRKAEAVRCTPSCPVCGGVKAVPPSSASSVCAKCYQRLPPELRHGLFKQHGEPEPAFRVRYPVALNAAIEFLRKKPVTQAEINQKAAMGGKMEKHD